MDGDEPDEPSGRDERELADPKDTRPEAATQDGLTAHLRRPILVQASALAFWPFLQQLLSWLVSFVDTAVAGRLSVEATNAIAIAAYFGWFITLMTSAVGSGGAAIIARAIGADRRGPANAALGQSILLSAGWSVFIGLGIWFGAESIGRLAGLDDVSRPLAVSYLRILAVIAPFTGLLFIDARCLSAAGDTRTPFLVMLAYNAVNIAGTLYLALESFTVPGTGWQISGRGLGVVGIAWGTAAAAVVGGALTLVALLRRGSAVRLRWPRLRPDPGLIRRIVRIAVPSLGEGVFHWSGNFLVIIIVGLVATMAGATAYQGAHIVAIRIEALSFLPAMALATAASTLTGQFLGAGRPDLAQRAANICWGAAATGMFLLGLTFLLYPVAWVRTVTDQPELLALSPQLVQICGAVQIFFGTSIVLGGAMRGAGDTRTPLLLTATFTWGVRLPLVVLLGWYLGYGLTGIWFGLCGELLLRGLGFAVFYLRGRWKRVEV